MSWNSEKEQKLRQLWKEGHSGSQIAVMLGNTTRNAVIGKAHRLSLSAKINNSSIAGGVSSKKNNEKHRIFLVERPTRNFLTLTNDMLYTPRRED